jgi:hypothetical protein
MISTAKYARWCMKNSVGDFYKVAQGIVVETGFGAAGVEFS